MFDLDSKEYKARCDVSPLSYSTELTGPAQYNRLNKPFVPPTVTLKEIHDAVPKYLLKRDPVKSTLYVARDIAFTLVLFWFASSIQGWGESNFGGFVTGHFAKAFIKSSLWMTYWWVQGLVWAGVFCLGHDAGHQTLYDSLILNNIVGFTLHSALLIPYFSWRHTHNVHHKTTASMERDENYVPYVRSDYNLPPEKKATRADYAEVFEETPLWTMGRMLIMQGLGWWIYLTQNTMGSKKYPKGTNHFDPNSPLFRPDQRLSIIGTDIALIAQMYILYSFGLSRVGWYYLIPYLLTNHWCASLMMFTYMHHSDPTIPHYRSKEWSFLRGAVATVDRPLLGWMGRFFFHNISHDHVAHHFFLRAPFYNGPKITAIIKKVLKDDYNYDPTPSFYALYRSFTQCVFVEEEGDIVFYKNAEGKSVREVDEIALQKLKEETKWNANNQDRISEEEAKLSG
ncbi:hypothetical protein FISHEDRAFT_52616 [Fistulina hepatica ATCC 64428]|nr:hypothetical protein FISHEDRAFT_52616 [Fistulina hepatica ATCC 64428]